MKTHRIAVLPGDGIGPDVIDVAVNALRIAEKAAKTYRLELVFGEAGLNAVEKHGTNVPPETVSMMRRTTAALKGPMTTSEDVNAPSSASLTLRRAFSLYANVRPCFSLPNVNSIAKNVDLVIVRENTEGLYAGVEFEVNDETAVALRIITRKASLNVAQYALKLASTRKNHLTYVHKANILRKTDGMFGLAVKEAAKKFPRMLVDDYHVDAMAMELALRPQKFDVIVTTNLFGDILSDEAAALVGGLGVVASANIGDDYAFFEPVHGSAPKLAGTNRANPIAAVFAAKMLLEHIGEKASADAIDRSVLKVLREHRILTADLGGNSSTEDVGKEIAAKLQRDVILARSAEGD